MRKIIALLVVVLVVAGAWTAGWLYAANEVRSTVAELGQADGETSPRLTCEDLAVSGFPFRLDVTCARATLVDGDVTATLAGLRASVLLYNPTHAILSAQAPATFTDAFTGSRSRLDFAAAEASIRLQAEDPLAALQGEDVRIARASLTAEGVTWVDTLAGDDLQASAGQLEVHLLDIPEQHDPAQDQAAVAIYATASGVIAPGFNVADGETSLEAEITGVPDDLAALGAPDLLQRWQAAGGEISLIGLKGTAGPDFLETTGTIGLDAAARPEGQLKLTSKGLVERLGDLFPPEWQALIVGSPADDGSYSQTLTLRGGIILSGLIPLGTLEPVI